MPALNFKKEFAEAVEKGRKRQTIRQVWKRPIGLCDTLYLYTGMRTKKCRKLMETMCTGTIPVQMNGDDISVGPNILTEAGREDLAQRDGFESEAEFVDFFRKQYGLPFEGVIILW